MHYEKTEQIQDIILNMCKSPMTCGQIAQRLDFSPQRTMYHLRQMIADHRIIATKAKGRMSKDTITYQTNTSGVAVSSLNKTIEKIVIDEPISIRSKDQQIKDSYSAGSAMRNVNNLAEKLKRQSQLMRQERKSSRTYVGISQVYNG